MIRSPSPDEPAPKGFRVGTHRACDPRETLARLTPHLARFGITRVATLTGLDRIGLPVVSVCRPKARSSAVFHGKGLDLDAAKVSGLMEAIETWHAEHAVLPLRFGSRGDFGTDALDPAALPRRPGPALPPDQPLLWAEGRDLIGGGALWVPFEVVHADFREDGPPASGRLAMTTNGLASGNTFWEAVCHALCEVIERDATALWRVAGGAAREAMRLDLGTVADPACRAVLDRFAGAGLGIAVWEITTEIEVPAFQCLIGDTAADAGPIGSGAGCHPAPGIALSRALTEAAQVRMTYIVGSREDLLPDDYTLATRQRRHRAAAEAIGAGPGPRRYTAGGGFDRPTFAEDVVAIGDRLRRAGFGQAVVVDLSRPDLDLDVVRVVVPGLEGSDHGADYVPGARAATRRGG